MIQEQELPLLSVAFSEIDNIAINTPPTSVEAAKQALQAYVRGFSAFEYVKERFEGTIGSIAPLVKVRHVLEVASGNTPPLPVNDKVNKKCRNWTPQEDIRLLAGIHRYGLGDWKDISIFVGSGFTRSQCCQRWCRALNPKIEKEAWTIEEQGRLLDLVRIYGEHNWSAVSKSLGGRSDVQCRYRYYKIKDTKREKPTSSTRSAVLVKKVVFPLLDMPNFPIQKPAIDGIFKLLAPIDRRPVPV